MVLLYIQKLREYVLKTQYMYIKRLGENLESWSLHPTIHQHFN